MSPPKRRQFLDSEELNAWKNIFRTGHDYWGAMQDLGFDPGPYHTVNRDAAAAAWRKLGERYMVEVWPTFVRNNPKGTRERPWALEQFGEP